MLHTVRTRCAIKMFHKTNKVIQIWICNKCYIQYALAVCNKCYIQYALSVDM